MTPMPACRWLLASDSVQAVSLRRRYLRDKISEAAASLEASAPEGALDHLLVCKRMACRRRLPQDVLCSTQAAMPQAAKLQPSAESCLALQAR